MSYKLVRAQHPDGGSSTMTEARAQRLELQYSEEGATNRFGRPLPASPASESSGEDGSAPTYSASMKRDELDAEAARLGIDAASFANKDELATALNAAASGQEG